MSRGIGPGRLHLTGRLPCAALAGASLCTLLFQSAPARADNEPPAPFSPSPEPRPEIVSRSEIAWRPSWRRIHALDYVATATFVGVAFAESLLPDGQLEGDGWVGGIAFDDAVRDEFGLKSASDRKVMMRISDALLTSLVAYPFVVDTALVTWLGHGSRDVAWQMMMINARAFAFTAALTGVVKRIANRERPALTACREDPRYDPSCGEGGPDYSFFSGHSATAFTGAALVCTHHTQFSLYGGHGDALACVSAMTAAALTGMARVSADRHYLTDVLTGASVGMISGAVLPWLLHYREGTVAPAPDRLGRGLILPLIGPTTLGAAYTVVY